MSAIRAAVPGDSSWFQRYLLPGFAFKAVVIGGGYATGRELAEFFLPSGPRGGLPGHSHAPPPWTTRLVPGPWRTRNQSVKARAQTTAVVAKIHPATYLLAATFLVRLPSTRQTSNA